VTAFQKKHLGNANTWIHLLSISQLCNAKLGCVLKSF